MARRRQWKEPKKPFDDALSTINTWERRVCYSTVTPEFTLTDLVNWLYPPDVLEKLRAAFVLTNEPHPDRREQMNFHVDGRKVAVEIQIDCDDAQICTPKQGLAVQQEDKHNIVPTILEYARIVQEWNIVREVVRWFNENATPGCARYYFPAMGNFLDRDHAFHQGGGSRYHEPKESIGLISHKVRQAAEIVTMATFCPHAEQTKEHTGILLTIFDSEDIHSSAKKSQQFFL